MKWFIKFEHEMLLKEDGVSLVRLQQENAMQFNSKSEAQAYIDEHQEDLKDLGSCKPAQTNTVLTISTSKT